MEYLTLANPKQSHFHQYQHFQFILSCHPPSFPFSLPHCLKRGFQQWKTPSLNNLETAHRWLKGFTSSCPTPAACPTQNKTFHECSLTWDVLPQTLHAMTPGFPKALSQSHGLLEKISTLPKPGQQICNKRAVLYTASLAGLCVLTAGSQQAPRRLFILCLCPCRGVR